MPVTPWPSGISTTTGTETSSSAPCGLTGHKTIALKLAGLPARQAEAIASRPLPAIPFGSSDAAA